MITVVQTPPAGTDFDGTDGLGLIDFSDYLDLPTQPTIVPVLLAVSVDNDIAESVGINCFLKPAADPLTTTRRIVIRRAAASTGFSQAGCGARVPRGIFGVATLDPWQLVLITTGKTATMSLVVSFTTGPAPGGGDL